MSTPETTPFVKAHNVLWTILEDSARFCALVPVGCRLKNVGGSEAALKHGGQTIEFPSTMIEVVDGTITDPHDSSGGTTDKRFRILVATGAMQADLLLEIEWVIAVAMHGWATRGRLVTWRSSPFIHYIGVFQQQETLDERRISRAETGWYCAWDGYVQMYFQDSDFADNQ
jgi:hypothetical protein